MALQRTRLRVLDLAWSRAIPSELVYALEDGSLHLLRASVQAVRGAAPPNASWPAAQVRFTQQLQSLSGDSGWTRAHCQMQSEPMSQSMRTMELKCVRTRVLLFVMQSHCILSAAALEPRAGARLAVAFTPHPRQLLLGAGAALLRCTLGVPGQPAPQPAILHTRSDVGAFVALAHAEEVSLDDNVSLDEY